MGICQSSQTVMLNKYMHTTQKHSGNNASLPDNISKWDVKDVIIWINNNKILSKLSLKQRNELIETMHLNCINGAALITLNDNDLKYELFLSLGIRRTLLIAINDYILKHKNKYANNIINDSNILNINNSNTADDCVLPSPKSVQEIIKQRSADTKDVFVYNVDSDVDMFDSDIENKCIPESLPCLKPGHLYLANQVPTTPIHNYVVSLDNDSALDYINKKKMEFDLLVNGFIRSHCNVNIPNVLNGVILSFYDYFVGKRLIDFIKDKEPDRLAWNKDTMVDVYDKASNNWLITSITNVNKNDIYIKYQSNNIIHEKILNRFDCNSIQSTRNFILKRKLWKTGDSVEVYSQSNKVWCHGSIVRVSKNMLSVLYANQNQQSFSKNIHRWSPHLK